MRRDLGLGERLALPDDVDGIRGHERDAPRRRGRSRATFRSAGSAPAAVRTSRAREPSRVKTRTWRALGSRDTVRGVTPVARPSTDSCAPAGSLVTGSETTACAGGPGGAGLRPGGATLGAGPGRLPWSRGASSTARPPPQGRRPRPPRRAAGSGSPGQGAPAQARPACRPPSAAPASRAAGSSAGTGWSAATEPSARTGTWPPARGRPR